MTTKKPAEKAVPKPKQPEPEPVPEPTPPPPPAPTPAPEPEVIDPAEAHRKRMGIFPR